MKAKEIADQCPGAQRQADGSYNVRCPAHKDGRPSCNVRDGDKTLLFHCYAGCTYEEVRAGFERAGILEERKEYTPEERSIAFPPDYINPSIHVYRDAEGNAKYYIHRMADKDGGKTFRQYRMTEDGTFQAGMKDIPRIPYNWHMISGHSTVFIVEGEQAADAMIRAGYPATTNPGGASTWQPELNEYFTGKTCIIIPDNDEPGRKHAEAIATALQGTAQNTIISDVCAGMPDKTDIVDWMSANPTQISRLYEITAGAPQKAPTKPGGTVRAWRTGKQMAYVTETSWTIRDLLPGEGIAAVYGAPGAGKTFFTLDAALSVACGKGYKDQQTKHGGVAYIALEGGTLFDNRCVKWAEEKGVTLADHPFMVTSDPMNLLTSGTESEVNDIINAIKDQAEAWKQPIKMVVVDTLNRAMAGGNENAPEDMGAFLGNCDRIWKALGCCLVIVHHSGKDEARGLRGHSSLLGAVNTEIQVTSLAGTDFKQAEVLKQRDGEAGQRGLFELVTLPVGTDSDGYKVTTCIVNHCDGAEAAEATKTAKTEATPEPHGKHQRVVWTQLKALMQSKGEKVMPAQGYPVYSCVTDDDLRAASIMAMDAASGQRSGLFDRAVMGLVKAGRINQVGGFTWIM